MRPDFDKAIGRVERKRLEKDGADYAEDGGVGADAQRERDYSDGGEAGAFQKKPQSKAKIV